MAQYTFVTPYVEEGYATYGLWRYLKDPRALSVVKDNGVWKLKRHMTDEVAHSYDELFLGGYEHTVDDAKKAELLAAGIGITEANFTAI